MKKRILTEDDLEVIASKDDLKGIDVTERLAEYAKKTEIPTKVSQLQNDKDFKTGAEVRKIAQSIKPDLSGYVQKENGKSLSSNDYTNADKIKLDAIPNFKTISQSDYDGLATKEEGTIYVIK